MFGFLALACGVGCGRGDGGFPNDAGEAVARGAPVGRMGYVLDVDTRRRSVRVAAPSAPAGSGAAGVSYSILEGTAIGITVDNYSVSEVGAFAPGKVRI